MAYLQFEGVEDDLLDIPYELTEEVEDGFRGRVISTDVRFRGAQLLIHPEFVFNLKRWRIGDGKTITLELDLGAYFGFYGGAVYDAPVARSFTPGGEISATPAAEGWDVIVHATESGRQRDGDWIFGYSYLFKGGLGVEFYGI